MGLTSDEEPIEESEVEYREESDSDDDDLPGPGPKKKTKFQSDICNKILSNKYVISMPVLVQFLVHLHCHSFSPIRIEVLVSLPYIIIRPKSIYFLKEKQYKFESETNN